MPATHLLEVLIPAYKRLDGCICAARSVATQIRKSALEGVVKISIVDDASPGISIDRLENSLSEWNEIISISKMTFSHQMIRLLFLEQLYRAKTILNGEKYHHS